MQSVYLGIGGNIGNKRDNFEKVYRFIQNDLGEIIKSSSVYETPPWGFKANENFWNQVILIETNLSPEDLIEKTAQIENLFGRKRIAGKYSSREMDIDILYYDDLVINTDILQIPHPRIPQRLFVLVPLAEIAPNFINPKNKFTNAEMLKNCEDKSEIKRIREIDGD